MRLSDTFGPEQLTKLKNNADEIREQNDFIKYFKGIYIGTDSNFTKALYYFNLDSTSTIMRLHRFKEEKYFNFR